MTTFKNIAQPWETTLHDSIEQQAARTPNAVAVIFGERQLDYAELASRANRCAHYLRDIGVGPDVVVGVLMDRSVEMVVALLAILKAGGAYLPLDPTYPNTRLHFLIDDASVPVVLAQQQFAEKVEAATQVLSLDAEWSYFDAYPDTCPEQVNGPQDLAYVIYTSGSTGQPKGCMLSHAAICNRLQWMQRTYQLTPADRVLQKTPCTFDVSVWEFFWPLIAGAQLVLAEPQGHKDANYLARFIRDQGITVCHFVPSMLRFFLGASEVSQCTSLRDVFTSGEALSLELVQRFAQSLPARLHNLYGPTEAAVDVSYWACEERADGKVPIGLAIDNIQLHILDEAQRPVPEGDEGELCIGGVGLARGYLNRPELTAQRFVFSPVLEGERLYRTGDRARRLSDGNIEFLGRLDFQVKLRGLRIELGEIEATLREIPGVTEAAVLVRAEDEGDPKLVAYLESARPQPPKAVRRFVSERLPEYMVPSLVLTLAQLPVSVHGKLERKALPWPVREVPAVVPPAVAAQPKPLPAAPDLEPSDTMVAEICGYFADVLQQAAIDPTENLFDLGATSLTMVRVVERIKQAHGVAVPVDVFLDEPSVGKIAAYVARHLGATDADTAPVSDASPVRAAHKPASCDQPLAVIGLAGRYPGAADPDTYWGNLKAGVSSIGALPAGRKALMSQGDCEQIGRGGYLEDVASFDSLLFRIAPVEASSIDPQERLLLETAWATLEDAGHTPESLCADGSEVGVFIGAMWNDYQSHGVEAWRVRGRMEEFSYLGSLANRISFFDFIGPSLAVNTSCSSAMTAMHLACESLWRGECQVALVGGVNLIAHAYHQRLLTDVNVLSSEGICRPFSAQANGWVVGEGVGAVLLKPLDQAERDGDNILGLIIGSAIGHSGRSVRYSSPNAKRQAHTMRKALARAGVDPCAVSYIEAAAPGASMADAAELSAINEVFGRRSEEDPCLVGTVKANIGHLESASALSQLTKVLWQLRHGEIAPSLNSQPPNPLSGLSENGTIRIVQSLTPWHSGAGNGAPRRALINAVGAAGSAGHLVVEEYEAAPRKPATVSEEIVVPLSAATPAQLQLQVDRLASHLAAHPQLEIADVGHTLRMGRTPLAKRCAFVVRDLAELRRALMSYQASGPAGQMLDSPTAQPLVASWLRGERVDWSVLHQPSHRRVSLPAYPFARVPHWVGLNRPAAVPSPSVAVPVVQDAVQATQPAPLELAPVPSHTAAHDLGLLADRTANYLRQLFAQITEVPLEQIDPAEALENYGVSSLMIYALNEQLERDLGELSKTLFFEHPTLREIASQLAGEKAAELSALLGVEPLQIASLAPALAVVPAATPEIVAVADKSGALDVAIIGLSGRYPKARDLEEFWQNLCEGRDCISEIPVDRWDNSRYFDTEKGKLGKTYMRWGGFLDEVDRFDPLHFNISPRDAEIMDPQERLFLQCAFETLEDAGYTREALGRKHTANGLAGNVGVFAGVSFEEYQFFGVQAQALGNGYAVPGNIASVANRVSYFCNFHGPSLAVDTTCSSSLTALHLACQALVRGDCAVALAGGVNLSLHPNKYLLLSQAQFLAGNGRCTSFGEGGEGYVPGEGVGAVLLKPLAQAIADGDQIHGVIKGSAINHGGRANGYTVPNPVAQASVVAQAIRESGIHPRAVSYIEAHGTGTSLGDPIEIAGLCKAFGEHTQDRQYCAIGSAKSNIGHCESAAGMASLTKVLLQMRHARLAPSLHSETLNPNIDFAKTPFVVQRTLGEWARPVIEVDGQACEMPRVAGISSFGAGGSNAHLIVQEYVSQTARVPGGVPESPSRPAVIVLSARTEEQLHAMVERLLLAIDRRGFTDSDLADIAYTLQTGREAMDARLGFTAESIGQLKTNLQAAFDGAKAEGLYRGQAKRGREMLAAFSADDDMSRTLDAWVAKGKYGKLLDLWVKGLAIDWSALPTGGRPRRISLPSYPFATDRYWVPVSTAAPRAALALGDEEPFDKKLYANVLSDLAAGRVSVEQALQRTTH